MTVFISAGEASGDAYGAALAAEMKRLAVEIQPAHDLEFLALGGKRLAGVADRIVEDTSKWGAMSVTQSLKVMPRILFKSPLVRRVLSKGGPGAKLAVPIDFGFFNTRFARNAKAKGWKILAFIPPGSWRRDRQAKSALELYDGVSTPFPWSAEQLSAMGVPNVHWFGHPIKQLLRDRIAAASKIERLDQIAIMPGSRHHELDQNLPLIAESIPDIPAEFALAAGSDPAEFLRRWKALAPGRDDKVTVGDSVSVLLRSKAAIVCSGTATLEAALCRCPMVVIYKLSNMMLLEIKLLRLKRPKYIALPNILLDRMLLGEFVVADAVPEKVRPYFAELLVDSPTRQSQLDGFEELDAKLGPDDAITQTARLALQMLSEA